MPLPPASQQGKSVAFREFELYNRSTHVIPSTPRHGAQCPDSFPVSPSAIAFLSVWSTAPTSLKWTPVSSRDGREGRRTQQIIPKACRKSSKGRHTHSLTSSSPEFFRPRSHMNGNYWATCTRAGRSSRRCPSQTTHFFAGLLPPFFGSSACLRRRAKCLTLEDGVG